MNHAARGAATRGTEPYPGDGDADGQGAPAFEPAAHRGDYRDVRAADPDADPGTVGQVGDPQPVGGGRGGESQAKGAGAGQQQRPGPESVRRRAAERAEGEEGARSGEHHRGRRRPAPNSAEDGDRKKPEMKATPKRVNNAAKAAATTVSPHRVAVRARRQSLRGRSRLRALVGFPGQNPSAIDDRPPGEAEPRGAVGARQVGREPESGEARTSRQRRW